MLLVALDVSLLGNMLALKGALRANELEQVSIFNATSCFE